jgi:dipeptidyl aminopeptidase/acylaminoacyl peptidase
VKKSLFASAMAYLAIIVAGQFINGCWNHKNQAVINLPSYGMFQFGENEAFIQIPDDYDPDKAYPLILFFHGRGGDATWFLDKTCELKPFLIEARRRGYIFAAPSYGTDSWMNTQAEILTLELIEFLHQQLSLDSKQLFLLGNSMGGGATLTFTARHAEKVTAACDVYGISDFVRFYNESNYKKSISDAFGGSPEQFPEVYRQRSGVYNIEQLKSVPLLILHGDSDRIVPLWHSEILYDKLKAVNAQVELILVPGIGHNKKIFYGQENRILDFFETARSK